MTSGYRRSVSQLHRWLDCSEAYFLERMVKPKLPQRPAAWLALGTAFHDSAAQWELSGRREDFISLFFDFYDRDISILKDEQPDLSQWLKPPRSKIEQDIVNRRANGAKMVENYITDCDAGEWSIVKINGAPAVEMEFEIDLGGVPVVGFIDRILEWPNGAVTIRDDKTGNREKRYYQLGVYALAARELWGLDIREAEYWYAKDRGSSGFISTHRYTREYLTNIYATLDTAIDQRLYLPNPGKSCDLCGVKDWCREMGWEELPSGDS